MEFSSDEFLRLMAHYLLPFFRIAAFVTAVPVLSTGTAPMHVRLFLAIGLTAAIAPGAPALPPDFDPVSIATFILIIKEVLIGLAMGFLMQLIFSAMINAGQLVGMQMGLGFAQMMDPQTGVSVPVVSQFYNLLAILLFLALDGHLVLIQAIAESFNVIPAAGAGLTSGGLWFLVVFGGWIFAGAVVMVLPAIIGLLMINVVMGVTTRATPQMNIFAVGFSITITMGFIIIMVSLPAAVTHMEKLFGIGFDGMMNMLTK